MAWIAMRARWVRRASVTRDGPRVWPAQTSRAGVDGCEECDLAVALQQRGCVDGQRHRRATRQRAQPDAGTDKGVAPACLGPKEDVPIDVLAPARRLTQEPAGERGDQA